MKAIWSAVLSEANQTVAQFEDEILEMFNQFGLSSTNLRQSSDCNKWTDPDEQTEAIWLSLPD